MDVAASEFFKDGKYDLDFKNKDSKPEDWITSDALCEMYKGFVKDAPVVSIEDPFDQDDWAGWTKVFILIITMQNLYNKSSMNLRRVSKILFLFAANR